MDHHDGGGGAGGGGGGGGGGGKVQGDLPIPPRSLLTKLFTCRLFFIR